MESESSRLARKIMARYEQTPETDRILIAISGIPGSGKSTLARQVAAEVNRLHAERFAHGVHADKPTSDTPNFAVDLPMDGFHLSRAQLSALPNAAEAIHRRGAAFTFDGEGFLQLVRRLREPLPPPPIPPPPPTTATTTATATTTTKTNNIIYAPSFDHALKDPIPDDIPISPYSRILIFEGNYLSLSREPWQSAASLMDELWFIHVDRQVARQRLIKRHVLSGIVPDEASARHRVDSSDLLNADDVLENGLEVQEMIRGG